MHGHSVLARPAIFLEALPLAEVRRFSKLADTNNFYGAWFPEITFGDAFIPAAAAALETSRLLLATGVVGIWSRSPVAMALTAASLDQLAQGRLILGLGLQARSYVTNWHGRTYRQPVQAMREYVTIVRGILSGSPMTYEGQIFQVRNFQLQIPPPSKPIPIHIAGIGPRMIELAGECAEGLLGYCYSLPYLEEVVLPQLEKGARKAGRQLEDITITCGFPTLIGQDEDAFKLHRGQILMFATATRSSPFYRESLSRAGFGKEVEAIQLEAAAGEIDAALAVITPEMVDAITLTGTPEQVRKRIATYQRAGIHVVAANPSPPGAFFPLYQGHFPESVAFPPFDFPAFLESVEATLNQL